MATTQTGVDSEYGELDLPDATDAFLSKWTDAGTLSDEESGATPPPRKRETAREEEEEAEDENESEEDEENLEDQNDSDADDDSDEESEDSDDTGADEEDKDDQPTVAGDEALVKLTVDGEEKTVSVKELKRLYGQEASLTRKSQEVSVARKKAEDEGARFTTAAQALLQRAYEKFEPYQNIDWVVAQSTLNSDELVGLRNEARATYEEVAFLQNQVDTVFQQTIAERQAALKEGAKEMQEVLADPQTGIPGWNDETYDSIRSFAVQQGIPEDTFAQLVDPVAIKLINMARLYTVGQKKLGQVKKKATAPKKVLKSNKTPGKALKQGNQEDAVSRLRKSGSVDDAADAFMARWDRQGNDD